MKSILTSLFFVIISFVHGQTTEPATDYEALTYRLYTEKKWDSLLLKGKEAIASGSNYFYILTRTGTAAYYQKKYSMAARYFDRARQLNAFDNYTNEMLFYSCIYNGSTYKAALLTKDIDNGDSLYLKYFHPTYYAEGGIIISGAADSKEKGKLMKELKFNYREEFKDDNGSYFLTGWKQPLGRRLALNAAFSYTTLNKEREITIRNRDSVSGSYSVRQSEAYISPSYTPVSRIVFSPSFRYAFTEISEPLSATDSLITQFIGNPVATSYFNYAAGSEFTYYRNYWRASAGFWTLEMNKISFLQGSASVMFLPLGNMDLYSSSGITWRNKRPSGPFVLSQMIGFRTYRNTWLELSFTNGNLAGTVENNAQLMNNQVTEIDYRIAALFIADISRQIRLSLRYQFMKSNGTVYYTDLENVLMYQNYKYSSQIITGGLTWNIF